MNEKLVHALEVIYIHIYLVYNLCIDSVWISVACKNVLSHFSTLSLNLLVSRNTIKISDFCKE